MAAALVESMNAMSLRAEEEQDAVPELTSVSFKVAGMGTFDLDLELAMAVRDVKKLAKACCSVEPEHMRLIYEGRVLKESDTLECYKADGGVPVQLMFTAGHDALLGGNALIRKYGILMKRQEFREKAEQIG